MHLNSGLQIMSARVEQITNIPRLLRLLRVPCILLLVILLLCSCTTPYSKLYAGPDLPEIEIAVLKNKFHWGGDHITLYKVDGEDKIPHSGYDNSCRIGLLPGKHTLTVECRSEYPVDRTSTEVYYAVSGSVTVEFTALAGHVYEPKAKLENQSWKIWVEDVTGKGD